MSTVVKDLGAVSAYAYAVEKGYTGTEAEYAELMASYATVGQTAVDAKDTAVAAKTAAETAAGTATNKASEASRSASTASTKATEATTAAGTATTAKNDAVAAKTAAETAQGKAEDAQAVAEAVAESITSDYSQLSEDVSDLKENLNSEIARAETEEARIEALFTQPVEEAVNDWLDNHPEATTTVEDGSLTVAKFTESAQAQVVNNYVTPEMFGAKGDGVTDDTQAIKNMLASQSGLYAFSEKDYKITSSIDFTEQYSVIRFDNTRFVVEHKGAELIGYAVGFKASHIQTIGQLRLKIWGHAYIGIWLQSCGGSNFDSFLIDGATVWGIYMYDASGTGGNNGITLHRVDAMGCGRCLKAKGKYLSANQLAISDIDYARAAEISTDARKEKLLTSDWGQLHYVVDDSGYTYATGKRSLHNRMTFSTSLRTPFMFDEGSYDSGVYNTNGRVTVRNDYTDGDDGRTLWLLVGGGVKLGSGTAEGVFHAGTFSASTCPIGLDVSFSYAGTIDIFMLHNAVVGIGASETVWSMIINYAYFEAIGYVFTDTTYSKYIYMICPDYNTQIAIGSCQSKLSASNTIALNAQNEERVGSPLSAIEQNIRKVMTPNLNITPWFATTITEQSPKEITLTATEFWASGNSPVITLNLINTSYSGAYGFSPLKIYVKNKTTSANAKKFRIGITTNLINLGYSINGAVDNVLVVDGATFGDTYKVTIVLFEKTFYVKAEPLTFVDNTTT